MRSEAIHLADLQPPLLDVVATLDLPELEDWENLCAAYDLPKPPKLLLETAQALNEAYAAEQPIQSLLGRHRLLALVRAPLADRIPVMRDLAAQDVENPYWDDDLRSFERARIVELRAEASAAVKNRDGGRILSLLSEVEAPGWRCDPPADLGAALRGAGRELRRADALTRLKGMLPEMEVAYNAMDAEASERLLSDWDVIAAGDAAPVPQDLLQQVRPLRDWLEQEHARQATEARVRTDCGALAGALDADAPNPDLISLRRVAESHGMPIPAELRQRFDLLLEQRELSRRRRVRRNAAIITTAVLLCAAGIGLIIQRSIVTRQARQWATQIQDHVTAGRLAEGSAAFDNMLAQAPQFKNRPEVVEAKRQLDEAVAAESKRRDDFRSALDQAMARGPLTPDLRALSSADKLATTNAEKLSVLNFREKIESQKFERQRKTDATFRARVSTLVETVSAMEKQVLSGKSLDGLNAKIDAAEKDAADIAQSPDVTAAARQAVGPLTQRLSAIRTRSREIGAEAAALDQVLSAGPQSLAQELQAFTKKFPDSTHSLEFNLAAEDAGAWQGILDWSRVAGGWGYRFVPSSAQDLAKKQTEIETFLKDHPNSPVGPALVKYQEYLTRAAAAMATDGPWKSSLRATMNSPLVRDLNVVQAGEKTYYVVGDGGLSARTAQVAGQQINRGVQIKAVVTNDIEKLTPRVVDLPPDAKAVASPQAKLSADVLRMVDAFDYANWETFGPSVIQRLRADKQIDPVLGAILATRIERSTKAAGWGMEEPTAGAIERLEALNADEILWMNPDDNVAIQSRPRAQEVLNGLPQLADMRQHVAAQRSALFGPLGLRVTATTIIVKEDGKPHLHGDAKPQDGAEVYALLKGSDGAPTSGKTLKRIGTAKSGQWTLDPLAKSIPEGSLVFIREASASK